MISVTQLSKGDWLLLKDMSFVQWFSKHCPQISSNSLTWGMCILSRHFLNHILAFLPILLFSLPYRYLLKAAPNKLLAKRPLAQSLLLENLTQDNEQVYLKDIPLVDERLGMGIQGEHFLASYSTQICATHLQCFKTHIHKCHIPPLIFKVSLTRW